MILIQPTGCAPPVLNDAPPVVRVLVVSCCIQLYIVCQIIPLPASSFILKTNCTKPASIPKSKLLGNALNTLLLTCTPAITLLIIEELLIPAFKLNLHQ